MSDDKIQTSVTVHVVRDQASTGFGVEIVVFPLESEEDAAGVGELLRNKIMTEWMPTDVRQ